LSRFDALILDFDGVLVQSVDVKTRAFAELYAEHGPEIVGKVVGHHLVHGGLSRFEKFRHYHRVFLGCDLGAEEEAALGNRFAALVEDAVVAAPWVAGAREYLEGNHARLPIFIASGTPETELVRIVERRGMSHYLAGVHGSPRTKGQIIGTCIREGGLDGSRVLMVGDSITDYEGAREAGVAFLGIAQAKGVFPDAVPLLPDLTRLEHFMTLHHTSQARV
jgi:phosphoglycolate phosphatase-like HAD superfamily hydrolase